jgi:hypothetical protein
MQGSIFSRRQRVKIRASLTPDAELVLARHETAPETWQGPLIAELDSAGASADPDLIAAAQALMRLLDNSGTRAGKYTVDVRGAQGVQIGDHSTQHNVYRSSRDARDT